MSGGGEYCRMIIRGEHYLLRHRASHALTLGACHGKNGPPKIGSPRNRNMEKNKWLEVLLSCMIKQRHVVAVAFIIMRTMMRDGEMCECLENNSVAKGKFLFLCRIDKQGQVSASQRS